MATRRSRLIFAPEEFDFGEERESELLLVIIGRGDGRDLVLEVLELGLQIVQTTSARDDDL